MPRLSGIECVRLLRRQIPALLPIMLTLYADDELIFGSLQAGAVGYLLKRSTPDEIRDAIREVHAGGSPMTPEIARRVAVHFCHPPVATPCAANHGLTPREDEILRLIAQGRQTKEIARGLDIAVSTVSNHLRSIYAKLEVTSRVAAVAKMRPR
jgi:DNA-binding NarL/FixJ family response regulator